MAILGKTVRQSDARLINFLLNFSLNQCAEDIQDRACKGFRSQMRHTGD
jgi:hypothetical protein